MSKHGRRRDPDSIILPMWWLIAGLALLAVLAVLIAMAIQSVQDAGDRDVHTPPALPAQDLAEQV